MTFFALFQDEAMALVAIDLLEASKDLDHASYAVLRDLKDSLTARSQFGIEVTRGFLNRAHRLAFNNDSFRELLEPVLGRLWREHGMEVAA